MSAYGMEKISNVGNGTYDLPKCLASVIQSPHRLIQVDELFEHTTDAIKPLEDMRVTDIREVADVAIGGHESFPNADSL